MSRANPTKLKCKPRGRPFPKGTGGNPAGVPKDGRPRKRPEHYDADVRKLARMEGLDAIVRLAKIMNNARAPFSAQIAAAVHLLDRGYGRPAQAIDINAHTLVTVDANISLEALSGRIADIRERLEGPKPALKPN